MSAVVIEAPSILNLKLKENRPLKLLKDSAKETNCRYLSSKRMTSSLDVKIILSEMTLLVYFNVLDLLFLFDTFLS